MRMCRVLILLLAITLRGMPASGQAPAAAAADVASLDAILAALYDVISGPAGARRDWDRFRSLMAPGARLIPTRPAGDSAIMRVLSPDDYVRQVGPTLERQGFFEREIHRTTETFGAVTHAFSTYESRRTAEDPEPSMRGINSIQLFNDGRRWWVVTIFWSAEGSSTRIPPRYLP
jgi:hypothetical protein